MYYSQDSKSNIKNKIAEIVIKHLGKYSNAIDIELQSIDKYAVKIRNCDSDYPDHDLALSIDKKLMNIDMLYKCKDTNGTLILKKMVDIARDLGMETVSLMDGSTTYFMNDMDNRACGVSLWALHILIHGESWYNQQGFKSLTYEDEVSENKRNSLDLPVSDFIKAVASHKRSILQRDLAKNMAVFRTNDPYSRTYQRTIQLYGSVDQYKLKQEELIKQSLEHRYLQDFISVFADCDTEETTKQFMSCVNKRYIKNNAIKSCNDRIATFIKDIVNYGSSQLDYDIELFLKLT